MITSSPSGAQARRWDYPIRTRRRTLQRLAQRPSDDTLPHTVDKDHRQQHKQDLIEEARNPPPSGPCHTGDDWSLKRFPNTLLKETLRTRMAQKKVTKS